MVNIQMRRDTAANLAASGYIPRFGEPVGIIDATSSKITKLVIGDGVTLTNSLPAVSKGDKGDPGAPGSSSGGGGSGTSTHPASQSTGTAITIDTTQSTTQVVTISGDTTVTFGATPPAGAGFQAFLTLKQDSTGGRRVTWPANILWPQSTPPVLSTGPGAVDAIQLRWDGVEWLGALLGPAFAKTSTAPTTAMRTLYNDSFSGSQVASAWQLPTSYPTGGTVAIVNGALRLSTNSATQWTGAQSVFLGDRNHPEGVPASNIPAIVSDAEYWFDWKPSDVLEQYLQIGLRVRSAELWNGGAGGNMFSSGYNLSAWTKQGKFQVQSGYNAGAPEAVQVDTIPFTFTTAGVSFHIIVKDKTLQFRAWTKGTAESTAFPDANSWTYTGAVLTDESDGSIGFTVANGPDAVVKTLDITNFRSNTNVLGIGTPTSAPATDPAGFTRVFTENFGTTAPSGTGTSSFLNVYANSIQPYDEVSPTYQQRALLSAHDGVLDVAMDGARGAAFAFGTAATANSRLGGRFAMRAKAIGAFGNGPAVMIWPSRTSDGPWSDGEIDFPESVSGPGGFQGFQDTPWIHHHQMNVDMQLAQDVNLLVSWRDWHVYSVEWYLPGKGPAPSTGMVIYYVDEVEVFRTTKDVPTTVHRYMMQVGAYGSPGNMYIDWVTVSTVN
jgi:hypothetical protein